MCRVIEHPMNRLAVNYCRRGGRNPSRWAPVAWLAAIVDRASPRLLGAARDARASAEARRAPAAILRRVWALGGAVPRACRFSVDGYPALANPETGIIFVLGGDAEYFVRPPWLLPEPVQEAIPEATASAGDGSRPVLGPEWTMGSWSIREFEWCRIAYHAFQEEATAEQCRGVSARACSVAPMNCGI